jgi:hypothetical protein
VAGARNIGRAAAHSVAANATAVASRSGARSGACSAAEGAISTFHLTETTLSESGLWLTNTGLDWTKMVQDTGRAYATHGPSSGTDFRDSYAYINPAVVPFGPDQHVKVVLKKGAGTISFTEWEILLRVVSSAHLVTLIECNLAHDGQYQEIIGWKGALGVSNPGDFEFYSSGNPVSGGVNDGDVFEAQIIGNNVTTFINGVVHATADISGTIIPHPSGQPGIGGFTTQTPADMAKIGFTFFQAIAA